MTEYINKDWQEILKENNLADFDAIWDLKSDWFEEPNIRRGGWSGVVKVKLNTTNGKVSIFIKRQQNHASKTLFHPIKGCPTFEREFKNIVRLTKHKLPTLTPVYFAKRTINGDIQAILITEELEGYIPLDSEHFLSEDAFKDKQHKHRLFESIATVLRNMHRHHYQHNCFYLKHVFVKADGDSWDIKIIDLEKLKWCFSKKNAIFRDLLTLHRHATSWSKKDRMAIFKYYVEESKLSGKSKDLWHAIEKKVLTKGH